VKETAEQFEIPGHFAEAASYGGGHIHDTYLLRFDESARSARYILQQINTRVFRDPVALMDNLSRICSIQRRELEREGADDPERRHLRLVPTTDGRTHWVDPEGGHWRCFHFQEGTRSLDRVETEQQAHETARAFACFAARMTHFEGPRLAITIPDFHNLEHRYEALEAATRRDSHGRAKSVEVEIDRAAGWYEALRGTCREEGAGNLPIRIVHNDCKINNLLLDAETGEGLCAIDLDTVMDGTVLADFGELVRTSSCRSAEDEAGLGEMAIELDLVRGVARGYLSGMGAILTAQEVNALPLAGPLMAFENAVRFLTDHLSGDVYFRIHHEAQNLDRARAQLRRVELLDAERDEIRKIIESAQQDIHRTGKEEPPSS
jgi:Ser/Thr protein kinase RdoA (MazF antagonist)